MEKEKRVIIKNLVLTVLVIVLFVGIILTYYRMLYEEKRDTILKDGKTSAERTADQVNDYLETSISAIKLTGYTLDEMIKSGRSYEEIQDYLVGQSVAVTSTVFENTKGVYGYIAGAYHDGSGWSPGEDYVPTERPWYIRAMHKPGSVVLVDPYVDAQTGNVMMSIAKLLFDNQSVVAMDIYLDKLQDIVEQAVRTGGADIEFILDSQDMVIAHSVADEVGKIYGEGNASLGSEIIKRSSASNADFYEFSYEGTSYIIYKVMIGNDWKCVSVKEASSVFVPIRIIFGLTLAAVMLVIIMISGIMLNSNRKQLLAEKLSSQLSSTADIYVSLHEIDFLKDSISRVRDNGKKEDCDQEKTEQGDCQGQIRKMMEAISDASSWNAIAEFVDFTKLDQRMKGKNTITLELLNKERKWCRARFIVSDRMADGRVTRAMFLVEDIDDERTGRDKLIRMSQRAMAASEAKSSFLSNMSHEIRTPINAVLGMNEMILRESDDDNILTYADNIRTAGGILLGIVNDILDFSKIEAGKMEIIPVEYDISGLINDLAGMIRTRADDKGLQLILEMDKEIPRMLYGDEVRIKQVITNILTNAVKYTEKGSVSFGITSERCTDDPDAVILEVFVKDTGIGIKQEDMKKLFSEFERIDEEKHRNIEGTGLGMNITRSLLALMDSTLKVESIYGIGSKFSFRLRQRVTKWEPLGDYEKASCRSLTQQCQYREKFTAPGASVLMVDDNEMNRMVFKGLVKQTLVETDTAADGDTALVMLQRKKYDIIFLDHLMPGKDGIETLKELKQEEKNPNLSTPVICLTANAISGAREKYIAAGFDDYLTKPVDPVKLGNMLMEFLPGELIRSTEGGETAVSEKVSAGETLPTELAALAGQEEIDVAYGLNNIGSTEAYLSVLHVYRESVEEKMRMLEQLWADRDLENYRIRMHAQKSSLRTIGARKLGEEAQRLEDAGKNGDTEYIRGHHSTFLDACMGIRELLNFLSAEKKEDKDRPQAWFMADILRDIRRAAEELDCMKLEELFLKMEEYTVPEKDAELWGKLEKAYAAFDYDRIVELLG